MAKFLFRLANDVLRHASNGPTAVSSSRKWSHYSELSAIDAWILLLYCFLFRFRLVPRALAGFGLLTVALHFTGITLPLLLGLRSVSCRIGHFRPL